MIRLWLTVMIALAAVPLCAEPLPYVAASGGAVRIVPQWAEDGLDLTPTQMNALRAELRNTELRFDLNRYLGKRVRIHLALPLVTKGLRGTTGLRAEWKTRGAMTEGNTVPGSRALVFEGVIKSAQLKETFDFVLHIDARVFLGNLGFDPSFDIEIMPDLTR